MKELNQAVYQAMQQQSACAAVRKIYVDLQRQIDERKPLCVASGKCCNFASYGHRLYVTTLELATFLVDLGCSVLKTQPLTVPVIGPGCPLQQGRLCGVHTIRPFGCRIFFCDPTAADWQQQQYEIFHSQLKQLHNEFEIPYLYVEWRAALAAMGVGDLLPDPVKDSQPFESSL